MFDLQAFLGSDPAPEDRPTVIVADDSATVRAVVSRTLMRAGFHVTAVADGLEAVDLIRRQPPALAVLDIDMPGLDGYGVCQEMRQLGQPWERIPIVLLTSRRSHALELLGSALGAYLPKPVSPSNLVRTVQTLVEKSQLANPSVRNTT